MLALPTAHLLHSSDNLPSVFSKVHSMLTCFEQQRVTLVKSFSEEGTDYICLINHMPQKWCRGQDSTSSNNHLEPKPRKGSQKSKGCWRKKRVVLSMCVKL